MERQILHLRVASFPVAVYQVKDPSLKKRPLIVSAGRGPRAVVLSVSVEARQEGARPGMTLAEALRWSRRALVLPPDPILFERADRALTRILSGFSPVVEPAGDGRLFADMTGMGRLLGPARDAARKIQKEIERCLRLGPNAGLGANKLVSSVAARLLRPVGLRDVLAGQEAGFLSPLEVRHLPAVDPRTEGRLLDELNIRRVRDLASIDLPHLNLAFGGKGLTLYRQARGIDESPVRPPERSLSVEADETLPEDSNDDTLLLAVLFGLVERCGARLRRLGIPAGEAALTARYSDGVMSTRLVKVSPPSMRDLTLHASVRPLFEEAVGRRGRVRYLRLRCAKLAPGAGQMDLFDDDGRERPLIEALDRIRGRFGTGAILFGRASAASRPAAASRGVGDAA